MRCARTVAYTLLLLVACTSVLSINSIPRAHADAPYSLNPVPALAQEGSTISLVLTVTFNPVASTTMFQFRFSVTNPAGTTFQSQLTNYTATSSQDKFSIIVAYPSPSFVGSNSLAGQYTAKVDQLLPTPMLSVASTSFVLSITDSPSYERTQTVNVQGSGYNTSETVGVAIKTQTTSTLVFSQTIAATSAGIVATSWKVPSNASIDNYVVTMTGASTHKTPPDTQTFSVRPAIMSVTAIASQRSTYQRTDTMKFSFQPTYPDGSIPSTGVALLTLARPTGGNVTLTATYDSVAQTFNASYRTFANNQTGTWTVTLGAHGYSDAYGNIGPGTIVTNSPQLTPASMTINVITNTNIGVGQQLKFNTTISYPDAAPLQSGAVHAYLVYSGTPSINDTVPVVYDTSLGFWIGTYTVKSADAGGLWSLIVTASDSSTPSNSGTATRAITIQNATASPSNSFPLFYFAIIASIIAGLLLATLLIFRRRRVSHTSLKIDLDAVHSEAGRIENQEFFKTIKEQVRKDMDDKA